MWYNIITAGGAVCAARRFYKTDTKESAKHGRDKHKTREGYGYRGY